MNFKIYHDGVDITRYSTGYTRRHDICTGVGELTVFLAMTYSTNIDPYDTFLIQEDGVNKGNFYAATITKAHPQNVITIDCQDATKQLNDYFIDTEYEITEPYYTKYWIDKFLGDAGVAHTFDTAGNGELISNNTSFGKNTALDMLSDLLKQSGWYLYVAADNVVHIGKLAIDPHTVVATFADTQIIYLNTHKDDQMLRNRVVVQGNGNPTTGRWIFSDIHTHTPWNYDDEDIRSVMIANSNIGEGASARKIANMLLKECTKITYTKEMKVAGFYNVKIGDTIFVNSKYFKGVCLITSLEVNVSNDEATTILTLDERCPRLIGYFDYGGYVYVSTKGNGVWRKPLKYIDVWENFSQGLTNLYINDLNIANGVYSCTDDNGDLWIRYVNDTAWWKFNSPVTFSGSEQYTNDDVLFTSSTISRVDGHIYSTVVTSGTMVRVLDYPIITSGAEAWLLDFNGYSDYSITRIDVGGEYNTYAYDVDYNDSSVFITAIDKTLTSGTDWDFSELDGNWEFHPVNPEDEYEYYTGTQDTVNEQLKFELDGAPPGYIDASWKYTYSGAKPTLTTGDHFRFNLHDSAIGVGHYSRYVMGVKIHLVVGGSIYWSYIWDDRSALGRTLSITETISAPYNGYQVDSVEFIWWDKEDNSAVEITYFEADWNATIDWSKTSFVPCILKYDKDTGFENIRVLAALSKVECSKNYPIVTYGGNSYFNNGIASLSITNGDSFTDIWPIVDSGSNTLYTDARIFDIITLSGIVTSGYEAEANYSRLVMLTRQNLDIPIGRITLIDLSNNVSISGLFPGCTVTDTNTFYFAAPSIYLTYYVLDNVVPTSGYIDHIETSNNNDIPYIFMSTCSGDILVDIFQRDATTYGEEETYLASVKNNLADYKITQIRLDDII